MSWLGNLKNQWTNIQTLFKKSTLDAQLLEELEDLLLQADVGVQTATWLMQDLQDSWKQAQKEGQPVQHLLAHHIAERLRPYEGHLVCDPTYAPYVIMMVGVNGTGKTTTCAKVAYRMQQNHLKTHLVAGDLFRAAATEQLVQWGERLQIPVHQAMSGQKDAAGLIFQAYVQAQKDKADVLIVDTAGRLHHREDLMAELSKIQRVLQKVEAHAPHLTLLVLDGTSGQNAINQLKAFQDTVPIHGLIVTKLDGTAKGGMILHLTDTFHIPVYGIGSGERLDALEPFSADMFARSLVGLDAQ